MLGVFACFAAIEIGGAPIRRNQPSWALHMLGRNASIPFRRKANKPIKSFSAAAVTKKQRSEINFRSNATNTPSTYDIDTL